MENLICLAGGIGVGKNTVAKIVQHGYDLRGRGMYQWALADAFKQFLCDVFQGTIDSDHVFGPSEGRATLVDINEETQGCLREAFPYIGPNWVEHLMPAESYTDEQRQRALGNLSIWFHGLLKQPFTIRHALQSLGSEWGRNVSPTLWLDYVANSMKAVSRLNPQTVHMVTDVRFPNEAAYLKAFPAQHVELWRIHRDTGVTSTHDSEKSIYGHELGQYVDWEIYNPSTLEKLRESINSKQGWR